LEIIMPGNDYRAWQGSGGNLLQSPSTTTQTAARPQQPVTVFSQQPATGIPLGADTSNAPLNTQQQSTQQNLTGGNTPSGSTGGLSAADLAAYDEQEGLLRGLLSRSGITLQQGLQQLGDEYDKSYGRGQTDQNFSNEKFTNQFTDASKGQESALGRVESNAYSLANSVLQRIARAGGSGSSAYRMAAPRAITNSASEDRQNVQETYGKNFRNIDLAKRETDEDFNRFFGDLSSKRQTGERDLRSGILQQEQGIQGQLADIARNRTAAQGGSYDAIRAAGSPFQTEYNNRTTALDNLFNQFRTPYSSVQQATVKNPTLSDYQVDRTRIGASTPQQTQAENPYLKFLQQDEDERNPLA
jgi:hypothetical protein